MRILQRIRGCFAKQHNLPFASLSKFQTFVVDLMCKFPRWDDDDGSSSLPGRFGTKTVMRGLEAGKDWKQISKGLSRTRRRYSHKVAFLFKDDYQNHMRQERYAPQAELEQPMPGSLWVHDTHY